MANVKRAGSPTDSFRPILNDHSAMAQQNGTHGDALDGAPVPPPKDSNITSAELDGSSRDGSASNGQPLAYNAAGLTPLRTAVVLFSCCVGLFLSLMDASIVATAIYTIGIDLNAPSDATWVILGYMLAYVGFASVFTRFCDVIGRKWSVVTAYTLFLVMSLGCGFCQSLPALIACRVLQGIGGSGLYSLTFVIFPEISPVKFLPFVSTVIGLTVAVGNICGPILGGVITKHTTWRWVFWINAPIGIGPLILFLLAWPNSHNSNGMSSIRLSQVDFLGCFLMTASSVLIVFAIQEAGVAGRSWSSPAIVATLTVGLVVGVVLVAYEVYYGRKNTSTAMILPLRIIKNRVMLAAIVSTVLSGFSLFVIIFNVPLRFQIVNLLSSEAAGIRMIPLLGGSAIGSTLGGVFAGIRGGVFYAIAGASIITIVGDVLLSTLHTGFDVQAAIYGYQLLAGVGIGVLLAACTIMTTMVIDFKDNAVAQGLVSQARIFGGSIGIAASSAIFYDKSRTNLAGILTREQIDGLQSSAEVIRSLNVEQLNAVRTVFAQSFNTSLRVCTYIAVAGFVISLFCFKKNPPTMAERKIAFQDELTELIRINNSTKDKEAAEHHERRS